MRLWLILYLFPVLAFSEPLSESGINKQFCDSVGGQTETRHHYTWSGGSSYIQIDCETPDTVWEGGLDRRSSLDSIQQALFASQLTDKLPAVVIHDTDGQEGVYEYRIRISAELAGVRYESYNWGDSD